MVVPAKTVEKVGPANMKAVRTFDPVRDYALSGNDLNDLAVLVQRLNWRLEGDELRDWQNRVSLMVSNAG